MTAPLDLSVVGVGEAPKPGAAATGAGSPPTPLRSPTEPRIVGLDLSLTATGVADKHDTWVIPTDPDENADYMTRHARIRRIAYRLLNEHIRGKNVDLVVIEGPSYRSANPGAFDRAGLWWRVYNMLATREIPVAVVAPASRMRYATGKGQASKGAVIDACARRWPHWVTSGNDNRVDAAVLCAMALDHYGHPLVVMPAAHRAALDAVDWPELVTP